MNDPSNFDFSQLSLEQLLELSIKAKQLAQLKEDDLRRAERERKQAEEAEELRKKTQAIQIKLPLNIQVRSFSFNEVRKEAFITFKLSRKREDVQEFLMGLKGVSYNTPIDLYTLPFDSWLEVVSFSNVPKNYISEIKISGDTQDKINEFLTGKDYIVELATEKNQQMIHCRWNIRISPSYKLGKIPGSSVNADHRLYKYPLNEGWRIYKMFLELQDMYPTISIEYKVGVLEFFQKELEKRNELMTIAQLDVYEPYMSMDLNGIKPKGYQTVGARFAILAGGRCLIADPTGLGKSAQAIMFHKLRTAENPNYRSLVVCKASLVINWYREIKKLMGSDTKIALFSGSLPTDSDGIRMIGDKTFPFTIVSYNLIGKQHEIIDKDGKRDDNGILRKDEDYKDNLWVQLLNIARFDNLILDECQYINNADSGRSIGARGLVTKDVIELSATPTKNKAIEAWPILNVIDKESFPSESHFEKTYTYDGIRPKNPALSEALSTRMIRRERSRVQKDLPPINRIPHYFDLSPKARKVYNKLLQGVYTAIDAAGNDIESNINNILAKINRLRQVCAIDSVDTTTELANDIYYGYGEEDKYKKIIIFSQYQNTTYNITQQLQPYSEGFIRKNKDGVFNLISVPDRMRLVDKFMSDPQQYYLCATLFAAQEGLTITAAGACITNDLWWNHVAHEQAEGRAYGRTNDPHGIDSYYTLANNTIMIDIWDLIALKEQITSDTVTGSDSQVNMNVARKLIERLRNDTGRGK